MIVITASFTAELLKSSLDFLIKELNLVEKIVFAP